MSVFFVNVFSDYGFSVLNYLTTNMQFLKIQLQDFKMKKKFGTSNSIFEFQTTESRSEGRVDDLRKVERSI